MSFTAIVVLHDSAPELRALLDSLDQHLPEPPQLIVADTGSADDGPQLARSRGAQVIELPDNPGFGAANNAAIAHARHAVTVLLNPDTLARDDALARLAVRAERPALHVPRLLNADGSLQLSAHPLPGTLGALLGAATHPPLLPRPLRDRLAPHRAATARTVGWAIAACLAAPTALLRELGPFDPRIHLFGEDMDLCLRARARGIPTVLHPDLQLVHTGGHATHRHGEPLELIARQRRAVIEAHRGRTARALDDAAQAVTFATRAAGHTLLGGDARRPCQQLKALLKQRDPGTGPGSR